MSAFNVYSFDLDHDWAATFAYSNGRIVAITGDGDKTIALGASADALKSLVENIKPAPAVKPCVASRGARYAFPKLIGGGW